MRQRRLIPVLALIFTLTFGSIATAQTGRMVQNKPKSNKGGGAQTQNLVEGNCGWASVWAYDDSFVDSLGNKHYRIQIDMGVGVYNAMSWIDWSYNVSNGVGGTSGTDYPGTNTWSKTVWKTVPGPGTYTVTANYRALLADGTTCYTFPGTIFDDVTVSP